MKKVTKKGMGFKAAQTAIAKKQGISKEKAGAILAVGARKASAKAKAANPNLKKVTTGGAKPLTVNLPSKPKKNNSGDIIGGGKSKPATDKQKQSPVKPLSSINKKTPDSTSFFGEKAYKAGLKYSMAPGAAMSKFAKEQDQAKKDMQRQKLKGKSGYDKNGYPLNK